MRGAVIGIIFIFSVFVLIFSISGIVNNWNKVQDAQKAVDEACVDHWASLIGLKESIERNSGIIDTSSAQIQYQQGLLKYNEICR